MTCVVGYVDNRRGRLTMGADSCVTLDGATYMQTESSKLFRIDRWGWLVGSAGHPRSAELFKYAIPWEELPDPTEGDSEEVYLNRVVAPRVREVFAQAGHEVIDDQGGGFQGSILLGTALRLYLMYGIYYFMPVAANYAAIGAGASFALGAIHALEDRPELLGHERVYAALLAAENFAVGVRAPYHIAHMDVDNNTFDFMELP